MEKRMPWEIAGLIVAQLNGYITEAEAKQLEEWVNACEQNRILYERSIAGRGFEIFRQRGAEHDYQAKYRDFCRYVVEKKQGNRWKRWGYAAAGFLLPLALFIGLYSREPASPIVTLRTSIGPGQYQALLTLPDGQILTLRQNEKKSELNNTSAIVLADTLIYPEQGCGNAEQCHRISIPRGGEYILKLSDGTRVWLNAETELRYPESFSGVQRKVYLSGEAYFEVAHDSLHPFVIETNEQKLTVLGTAFAIRAYADERMVTTTLEEGKVNIHVGGQEVVLTPGKQSRLKNGRLEVEEVNTALYTAWHKGLFIFRNQSLEEILNTLSRWYNIDVFYTTAGLETIHFTGELQRYANIEEFLDQLQQLEKVRFTVKGRTVTVSKY